MPFDSVLPFTESTGPLASYSVAIIRCALASCIEQRHHRSRSRKKIPVPSKSGASPRKAGGASTLVGAPPAVTSE